MDYDALKSSAWKRLQSSALQAAVRTAVNDLWNVRPTRQHFAGSHPVSLMRKNLRMLQSTPYVVAEKSDGVRYLCGFFIVRVKANTQFALTVFINRNCDLFLSSIQGPTSVHNGTILDGELVLDQKTRRMRFVVFDCIAACNERVVERDYKTRLREAKEVLDRLDAFWASKGERLCDPDLSFEIKQVHDLNQESLTRLVRTTIPNQAHMCDGLIFTPVNRPARVDKNVTMFKWKSDAKHTIDFLVLLGAVDRSTLCVCSQLMMNRKGEPVLHRVAELHLSDICCMTPPVKDLAALDSKIVEFIYHAPIDRWVPLRVRNDKDGPNDELTVQKTIQNVQEDITFEEICNHVNM